MIFSDGAMDLLWTYKKAMTWGEPIISSLLDRRMRIGKEDPQRLPERKGIPSKARPSGPLIWVHVASVGEAQSMLALINLILEQQADAHVLVTSITRTSADMLASRLPARAIHQFSPVDHPDWVRAFMDHWRPDLVLWAESELWPNTLTLLKKRHIPVALLNAHMSAKSFRRWSHLPRMIEDMLSCFTVVLAQTQQDANYYQQLGARSISVTDNIKYSAVALPYDEADLNNLSAAIGKRPVWLYASSHDDEEHMACAIHKHLSKKIPDLLTIIALRHPQRLQDVETVVRACDLAYTCRDASKKLPEPHDDIYIAGTIGEMGLFYRLAPIACIGRSFSKDGGGGHNPIEAAVLKCAVVHGPHVQNLQQIYDDMHSVHAALELKSPDDLANTLEKLLLSPAELEKLRQAGYDFAHTKTKILETIVTELEPIFLMANLPLLKAPQS